MQGSKRRHYRVTGDDLNGIQVSMMAWGEPNPVHLIDISVAGAAIAFLDAQHDEVARLVGSSRAEPKVRIESTRLPDSLDITCRIAHIQQVDAGVVCGVAFLRRIDETFNLDRALLRVFNRRGAVRVEPAPAPPIGVTLTDPSAGAIDGRMRDLSLTGVGVTVPIDAVAKLPAGHALNAAFDLGDAALELRAEVRFGAVREAGDPSGDPTRPTGVVGIEFHPDDRSQSDCRKHLSNWVMRRQLEIQREQREAEADAALS